MNACRVRFITITKYKLSLSVFFIFFLLLKAETFFAQPHFSKTFPDPKFLIVGIQEKEFPVFNGSWEDTIALKKHGIQIDNWLKSHPEFSVENFKGNPVDNAIDNVFFHSLNPQQKLVFKETAYKLKFVLADQKKKQVEAFFNSKNKMKNGSAEFYKDYLQIYFMNKKDVDYLRKKIKG